MKTIWKYPIEIHEYFNIDMPKDAEVLSIQDQKGIICMWVLVNPHNQLERRGFRIYPTGQPVEYNGDYIGTFQLSGGDIILHLFEDE
jgi:hypothetical protein